MINWFLALSNVEGSPGLNLECISINDSSVFLLASFSSVFSKYASCPNKSKISSSLDKPNARSNVVTGTLRVLSIRT